MGEVNEQEYEDLKLERAVLNEIEDEETNIDSEFLECECLLDNQRGIYIPRDFAACYEMKEWGVSKEDEEILLAGPGILEYWEAWDEIVRNAEYKDKDGVTWHLFENGDLFAVVYGD